MPCVSPSGLSPDLETEYAQVVGPWRFEAFASTFEKLLEHLDAETGS